MPYSLRERLWAYTRASLIKLHTLMSFSIYYKILQHLPDLRVKYELIRHLKSSGTGLLATWFHKPNQKLATLFIVFMVLAAKIYQFSIDVVLD